MKVFVILILIIAFLSYVMIRRGIAMKKKFYGKSEEEINETLKKMLP